MGIVRDFWSGQKQNEFETSLDDKIKSGEIDYSDITIPVEIIDEGAAFSHSHLYPMDLEYANLPENDMRKPLMEVARCLAQGEGYIQEFQMECERYIGERKERPQR